MKRDNHLFVWVFLILIIGISFFVGSGDYKSGSVSGVNGVRIPLRSPYTNYHCVDDGVRDDSAIKNNVKVYACKSSYFNVLSLEKALEDGECLIYDFSSECIDETNLQQVHCSGNILGSEVTDSVAAKTLNCQKIGNLCADGACA